MRLVYGHQTRWFSVHSTLRVKLQVGPSDGKCVAIGSHMGESE